MKSLRTPFFRRAIFQRPMLAGWHLLCLCLFQLVVLRRASLLLGSSYGDFAHPFALATFAAAFTLMGLPQTVMRFLAVETRSGHFSGARKTLLRAMSLRIALQLLIAGGLVPFLLREDHLDRRAILGLLAFFVTQGLYLLLAAALQGIDRFDGLALGSTTLLLAVALPTQGLAGLFWLLALGYALGAAVFCWVTFRTLARRSGPAKTSAGKVPLGTSFGVLTRFSFKLSIGALFILSSDTAPILLLRDPYPAAVYAILALGFQLSLYPARLNSVSEGLILPPMSAAMSEGNRAEAGALFDRWIFLLRSVGIVLLAPIILALPWILRLFFGVEDPAAPLFAGILLVGVLPRFTMPAASSLLIAHGRPGVLMVLSGCKLFADLCILVLLGGGPPNLLLVAWVASTLAYALAAHAVAGYLLRGRAKLDGWQLVAVATALAGLLTGWETIVLSVGAGLAAVVLGRYFLRSGFLGQVSEKAGS